MIKANIFFDQIEARNEFFTVKSRELVVRQYLFAVSMNFCSLSTTGYISYKILFDGDYSFLYKTFFLLYFSEIKVNTYRLETPHTASKDILISNQIKVSPLWANLSKDKVILNHIYLPLLIS